MRLVAAVFARICAWLCAALLSGGCGSGAPRTEHAATSAVHAEVVQDAALAAARELARQLPPQATRCLVATPARLDERERMLVGLVSQADRVPWALSVPVLAYARAEVLNPDDHLATVEYLRFPEIPAQVIQEALSEADERELSWGKLPSGCVGELTCVPVVARFVDPQTVVITTRFKPGNAPGPQVANACAELLEESPAALEVSARRYRGAAEGRELLATDVTLQVRAGTVERRIRQHFAAPALAARALRASLTGGDDLPLWAGNPVIVRSELAGEVLVQRASLSFEELWLDLEDQRRVQAALGAQRVTFDPARAQDVQDPDRVLEHAGRIVTEAARQEPPARQAALAALDQLLTRARRVQPAHEGLARQHYRLRLDLLGDARGALDVADARLTAGAGDQDAWRLARRAALARLDTAKLKQDLAKTYGLHPAEASHIARELAHEVAGGADYERAEWAIVTGRSLSLRARQLRTREINPVRFPLEQLPRLLAYWAKLSPSHEASDLGVHLVGLGTRSDGARTPDGTLWAVDTSVAGRDATVLAAATWDDAQLLAQGRALRERFAPGPIEILAGVETIDADGPRSKAGFAAAFSGRIEDAELILERVSGPLGRASWPVVLRVLAEPLAALHGNVFPPDELPFHAQSVEEADAFAHAAEASNELKCTLDALDLRCRGGLGDVRAASRALLRAARAVLGAEDKAPWSGTD